MRFKIRGAALLQPPGAFDQEHQDRSPICYAAEDKLVFNYNYGKGGESEVEMLPSRDAHYLPIQPVALVAEVKAKAKVNRRQAHSPS